MGRRIGETNMRIISIGESQRKELTELEKAKAEMTFQRKMGGFGYKQAKSRYEKLLRKEKISNGNR